MKQSGSVILVILLAFAAFTMMYNVSMLHILLSRDIVAKRCAYEQLFRLNEALLEHGISLSKEYYTEIIRQCEHKKMLVGVIEPWPCNNELPVSYKGIITLQVIDHAIMIQSSLERNGTIKHILSCKLERKVTPDATHFKINSWQ